MLDDFYSAGTYTTAAPAVAAKATTLQDVLAAVDKLREIEEQDPLIGVRKMKAPVLMCGDDVGAEIVERLKAELPRLTVHAWGLLKGKLYFMEGEPPLPQFVFEPAKVSIVNTLLDRGRKYRVTRRGKLYVLHKHRLSKRAEDDEWHENRIKIRYRWPAFWGL